MAKFYGFDEKGKREYRQIKQRVLGGNRQTKVYKKWNYGSPGGGTSQASAYAVTTTDITAASGDTPGTGTVTLKIFNGTDYDDGDSVDAINPTEMPIETGARVPGQVLTVDGSDYFEIAWSDYRQGIPGWTDGNNQSIGHDASGEMEWQDDGECA